MIWYGLAWSGVQHRTVYGVWCMLLWVYVVCVWCMVYVLWWAVYRVRCDMIWYDMTLYDMTWHDLIWHCMIVYHDAAWLGVVWHDMASHDVTLHCMVWCLNYGKTLCIMISIARNTRKYVTLRLVPAHFQIGACHSKSDSSCPRALITQSFDCCCRCFHVASTGVVPRAPTTYHFMLFSCILYMCITYISLSIYIHMYIYISLSIYIYIYIHI